MSNNYLQSVESILVRFESLSKLNDKQVAALRANITRTLKEAKAANDAEMVQVLTMIQADLPEPKAKPANEAQTAEDIVSEYGTKYLAMSGGQRAAYKAKVTRRINEAQKEGDQEAFDTLVILQARIERDDKETRRRRILAIAGKYAKPEPETEPAE